MVHGEGLQRGWGTVLYDIYNFNTMKYFYLLFYHYEILFLIVLLLFHVFPISHFHYSFIYFLSLFSVSSLFCVLIDYFIDKIISQVSRVYVGSFHDKPIAREEHSVLFAKDREVLLGRLRDLPKVRNADYSCRVHLYFFHRRINMISMIKLK